MAYEVEFQAPTRKLGRADLVFKVRQDGDVLGTLKVSQGGVEWLKKNRHANTHKFNWKKFAAMLEEA